ncbi:THAP domain-containing protein 1 [Astyanax mexicanus]|uniref:THAP domain-containing protein 1 n=1 Tax=Astyanax mexicanus TaxID=7994 RepID=UPI0020CAC6B3|nr:THAP domain-containing protein 1 [Astyanax mexicanus]
MATCEACRNTTETDVTFYRFPQAEENLQLWIVNMGKAEGWTPSESSSLCSEHFTPECFDGSGDLLSDAIPTVFSSDEPVELPDLKESEIQTNERETTDTHSTHNTPAQTCDCEARIQAMEKAYRLKLLSAQLQIKKCQKELMEQTHRASKWQKKALILKSAVITMKLRKTASAASSEKPADPKH